MGFFKKPDTEEMLAAATVVFASSGNYDFSISGDAGAALGVPLYYVDWALNKDRKRDAEAMLDTLIAVFEVATPDDPQISPMLLVDERHATKEVEATVGVTERLRVAVAFRPRVAIATHLYATFGALWHGVIDLLQQEGAEDAIASLLDDVRAQLRLHAEIGLGMRAGVASTAAARMGAGERLADEIAAFAGVTADEFRALPECDRDRIYEEHARASVAAAFERDGA
jgi:hypothetical protein